MIKKIKNLRKIKWKIKTSYIVIIAAIIKIIKSMIQKNQHKLKLYDNKK